MLQLEVVLRKGQRLLDRGPYTGAWTEAALAPHAAAAHQATPPPPAVTGRRRGRAAYDAPSRRAASRNTARVECARKAAAPAAPATTASALPSWACCCTARLSECAVNLNSGLRFRGGPDTDHPGPDGPVAVQTRIWGAGPDPGAGPDQVFRARSRGFRALGREFFLRVLNEIFLSPEKIFPAGLKFDSAFGGRSAPFAPSPLTRRGAAFDGS